MKQTFKSKVLCLAACLLVPLVMTAAGKQKVDWFTPAFPEKPAIEIEPGDSEASSDFVEFPALPIKKGMTPVLKADIRMVCNSVSGWNPYCCIELNGKCLDRNTAPGTPRLLGRGEIMETTHPKEKRLAYWKPGRHPALLTLFTTKDTDVMDARIVTDKDMGYEFYFDISDFVSKLEIGADDRVENEKPNRLRFFNLLPKRYGHIPLCIQHLTIGYVPTAMVNKLSGIKLRKVKVQKTVDTLSAEGFKLNVLKNGALTLNIGREVVGLDSAFSYVHRPEMQFNTMSASTDRTVGEPQFKTDYRKLGKKSGELTITAGQYQIVRTMTVDGNAIRIKDRYKNTSKDDIGIVWKNSIYFSGTLPKDGWRLSGRSNVVHEGSFGSRNPSVYAKHRDAAVMMLFEDTVSRTLLESLASGNTYTATTEGMGLAAGKEITLEWSIYAGTKIDYWDIINQIRREWKVNVTVPGPFLFAYGNRPGIKLQLATTHPWLDYSDGSTMTRDQYDKIVRPKIAERRKKYPGIKLMGLVENNLINFDSRSVPWGKELPLTYGDRSNPRTRYGQYLSADLTKKLDAVTPFRDAILRDKNGNAMIDNYYIYNKKPCINLMVQPEIGNYRYKFFKDQCDFLMDRMGFDGVYIDQFNPTPRDGYSFDRWDGVSVYLNPDGTIGTKFYNYVLTGAPARMNIVRYIVEKKHGIVLTNGHPATREEQSSGRLSFCEIEGDSNCNPMPYLKGEPPEVMDEMRSHLAAPLVLGLRPSLYSKNPKHWAQILTKGMITALHNGVLYYYYGSDQLMEGPDRGSYEIANWMFPFTPVKIGKGVLVGKERTLTAISGKYTVGGQKQPKIGYFNDHGIPQDTSKFAITGEPGAWTVDVKLDDWNEIVIIAVQD